MEKTNVYRSIISIIDNKTGEILIEQKHMKVMAKSKAECIMALNQWCVDLKLTTDVLVEVHYVERIDTLETPSL